MLAIKKTGLMTVEYPKARRLDGEEREHLSKSSDSSTDTVS